MGTVCWRVTILKVCGVISVRLMHLVNISYLILLIILSGFRVANIIKFYHSKLSRSCQAVKYDYILQFIIHDFDDSYIKGFIYGNAEILLNKMRLQSTPWKWIPQSTINPTSYPCLAALNCDFDKRWRFCPKRPKSHLDGGQDDTWHTTCRSFNNPWVRVNMTDLSLRTWESASSGFPIKKK